MTPVNLKEILFEELDYTEGSGLESVTSLRGRRIPYIDQVYFVQDIPVAYFSQLREYSYDELRILHQQVWSQSRVPLLYVILPTEIRVYNGYAEPAQKDTELNTDDRLLQRLQQLVDVETARQKINHQLDWYKRLSLETGAFWNTPDGQRIKRESRADQRLLRAMDQVRRRLADLPNDQAYALLGRSIFLRYLEDRGILTSDWISKVTRGQAESYLEVLNRPSTGAAYFLFDALSQRFNGDLFPPDREREGVTERHLTLIRQFLEGYDFDTGQMSFWPYDFTYLPIELISGIYDTFLKSGKRQELGAYYTPLSLVDFMIEETLPVETARPEMTILDPACGSGVFLVRAYQQLVEAWKQQHESNPSASELGTILTQSIFGVDIVPEAIQIAAFSLYLSMLDFLKDEEITDPHFRFPSLKRNLKNADFFSEEVDLQFFRKKFDRIVGNPPWGRGTLKGKAEQWIREGEYPVGGKQIVQAFLWRVPQFCAEDGEIALLAPAKSTILVTSNTHEKFRQRFFAEHHIRAVVNFSALVYELFDDSISPSIALFYRSGSSVDLSKIVYGVPKPSSLSQQLRAIVLDSTEVKYLDREDLLNDPLLWKVASWGNPRDAALIRRLRSFPTLMQQAKTLEWSEMHEGFMAQYEGSRKERSPELYRMPLVSAKRFRPYIAETQGTVQDIEFHYPRDPEIYRGPLILIHKSQCQAAFSAEDVAYSSAISGLRGRRENEDLLKWLVVYINSPLAKYYLFLTSSRWAVERNNPIQGEYEQMPFYVPEQNDTRLVKILGYFDQMAHHFRMRDTILGGQYEKDLEELTSAMNELVFDIYQLNQGERQLVQDMVKYEIEFFNWVKRQRRTLNDSMSFPVRPPDIQMLVAYAETFVETVRALLHYQDQTLNAVVYQDGAPLSVVGFELASLADAKEAQVIDNSLRLREILHKLDRLLLEQQTPTLYMRRHVRIYDGPWLYLVRPSERRFWTRSQARADADSFIAEQLNRSKAEMTGVPY